MSSPEVCAAKRTAPSELNYCQIDVTTTSASVPYTTLTTAGINLSKVLTMQANGGDVTLVAGSAGASKAVVTGSTADSATNRPGFKIANGSTEEWWLPGGKCDRLYVIGSANCKLNVWEGSDLK